MKLNFFAYWVAQMFVVLYRKLFVSEFSTITQISKKLEFIYWNQISIVTGEYYNNPI